MISTDMVEKTLSRREVLALAAAAAPAAALGGRWAGPARAQPPSPIVKPLPADWFGPQGTNAESPWEAMRGQGLLVPSERFFVRNHTATPRIDAATWRLRVFGSGLRDPQGSRSPTTS